VRYGEHAAGSNQGFEPVAFSHGFFDESGKFKDVRFIAFAGWVGRGTQWDGFSDRWDSALRSERLRYFKSSDALRMAGQFERWPEKRRDALVFRLIELIQNHAYVGISSTASVAVVKAQPSHVTEQFGNDPNLLVFESCMLALMRHLSQKNENFTLVCDDEERYSMLCYKLLNKLKLRHALLRTRIASNLLC
jgi:hypothetical protein